MLWLIVILLTIIWIVIRRKKFSRLMKVYEQWKGDTETVPILGVIFQFFGGDEQIMAGLQHFGREALKQGGMTAFWAADYVTLMVADPPTLDIVLKTALEKSDFIRFLSFITDNGSVFAPVPIWRPRRKKLVPTFSPRNLTQFVRIFAEQSNIMAERLRSLADKGPFSIWKYINTYSMDSICESVLGIKINSQRQDHHPFLKAFDDGVQHITKRITSPWIYNDFIYRLTPSYRELTKIKNYLQNFTAQIITARRKEMANEENFTCILDDQNKRRSFLDLLIKSGDCDDIELIEEMLLLIMAGTDTSAVGTAFTAVMLARRAVVQERVCEELKEVFGNSKRPVEPEDLPRLKYLEAVIKESLRLYPPVAVILRDVKEDLILPSGMTLPKDLIVTVNIWALHRNRLYWGEDAELFRPERFLDSAVLRHPAQYMPFSSGPRNCIGYKYAMMSMTTALATILRRYRLLPATEGCDPDAPLRVEFNIMMKDVDNFTVRLESRHKL